ncbi:MAG TPA: NAD(P)/FAD-dependent oxidoreductase [Ktedonobacterales bacterium]
MRYDVAIVGAGPAGAASAIHLARRGVRVVLLDRATFPRDKPCAEYLSPAAEPLLRDLGVYETLQASRPHRLRGFRIFAPSGRVIQGDFAATHGPDGRSIYETGPVIRRLILDGVIVDGARAAGAQVREGWRLGQITLCPENYILEPVGGGEPIKARLLIAADGIHSTVARRLGLHLTRSMRKIGLVAHIRGVSGLGDYGEMHVAGRRYVGIAPMEPPGRGSLSNVAMVVDEARDARALAGKPERFLLEALNTFPALASRLDQLTVERHTLAISRLSVRARRLSGARLLLVGDATGYYDPFTGEGIYRALRGAEIAASVAQSAFARNDLSEAALGDYDRRYKAEFRGKRLVEQIIQLAVQTPPLMNHIARLLEGRKEMADMMIGVTGDFLPPSTVLRPGYLLRLVI